MQSCASLIERAEIEKKDVLDDNSKDPFASSKLLKSTYQAPVATQVKHG
jgi:hypothetical protein